MAGTIDTPIEAGTELDYLLHCVASRLGTLATTGYGIGASDRGGRVPRTIECIPFNGRFTEAELKKAAAQSPGMRVSINAVTRITHVGDGDVDLTLQFAAAIVTQAKALDWDGLAARTLQAVLTGMHWQNWGTFNGRTPFIHPETTDIRAENLFGDLTVKAGVTMWAISWLQDARLTAVSNIVDGPASLYVKDCPPYGPPPLGPSPNTFSATDRAAAEAMRDMLLVGAALAPFDADPNLGILLSWPVGDQTSTIYQVRQNGAWVDFRTHVYTHVETLSGWPAT